MLDRLVCLIEIEKEIDQTYLVAPMSLWTLLDTPSCSQCFVHPTLFVPPHFVQSRSSTGALVTGLTEKLNQKRIKSAMDFSAVRRRG